MKKFTHGIMVLNPSCANEKGVPVVHFVGYGDEPTEVSIDSLRHELETDEEFGLTDIANDLIYLPATEDILNYYNDIIQNDPDALDIDIHDLN